MSLPTARALPRQDARELLSDFASATGYESAVLAAMFDVARNLDRITCPATPAW